MKHILRIDASSIKESACLRRLVLIAADGYTTPGTSSVLVYGSAFHKGVEVYELTGGDNVKAVEAAIDYWNVASTKGMFINKGKEHLNASHLFNSVSTYCVAAKNDNIFRETQVLKVHDEVMVEKKFSIKIYEDDEYIVLLQGTIDKLAVQLKNDTLAVMDWKTTSLWNAEEYFEEYKMSSQLRIYILAVLKLAKMYPDREYAKLIQSKGGKIVAYIYGAFLKDPIGVEFKRSPEFKYSEKDLESFEAQLMELVVKYVAAVKRLKVEGKYPEAEGIINGACKISYPPYRCKYFEACSSMVGLNASMDAGRLMKGLLESRYVKREYRPLQFGGEGKL